ncbi:L-asparaginase II [Lederbergia galactosidilyticus]|uniref:asparaginase n=1 Tax=Lederbergia galactosidilytica TaxID=217031 RepID=UPI001AE6FEB7|nr:asparaginase [Lederbergia galactosidilytica]MBP1916227.1 L-asparaginase II [Lederbergia galactosidilytica]
MSNSIVAQEYRNNTLENTHEGIICVVNDKKEIIYQKGNPNQYVYYRSAMKPIQAIPIFTTSVFEKYHLTNREAALFTASQRGEKYHQEALQSLLEKLQLTEEQLVCSSSYPLNEEPKEMYIRSQKSKRKLFHNCAGKHLGIMAYARKKGFAVSGYEREDHPVQREILGYLSELSETTIDKIKLGTDGCGLPIASVPIKNMAISYLKFAAPDLIDNEKTANAVKKISDVMNEFPEIVASHNFICTALLEDPNIVAKGGAQGVYCLALKEERISIALKVLSGTELLWPILVKSLLEKFNYKNKETLNRLQDIYSGVIHNDGGKVVGHTEIIL